MRKLFLILVVMVLGFTGLVFAEPYQYVRPYTKSNGTFVNGYYRTSPNNTKFDNFSTKGNMNPFTGKSGTVNPYRQPSIYKIPLTYKVPTMKNIYQPLNFKH